LYEIERVERTETVETFIHTCDYFSDELKLEALEEKNIKKIQNIHEKKSY
jgi:hypothetical protein